MAAHLVIDLLKTSPINVLVNKPTIEGNISVIAPINISINRVTAGSMPVSDSYVEPSYIVADYFWDGITNYYVDTTYVDSTYFSGS